MLLISNIRQSKMILNYSNVCNFFGGEGVKFSLICMAENHIIINNLEI